MAKLTEILQKKLF